MMAEPRPASQKPGRRQQLSRCAGSGPAGAPHPGGPSAHGHGLRRRVSGHGARLPRPARHARGRAQGDGGVAGRPSARVLLERPGGSACAPGASPSTWTGCPTCARHHPPLELQPLRRLRAAGRGLVDMVDRSRAGGGCRWRSSASPSRAWRWSSSPARTSSGRAAPARGLRATSRRCSRQSRRAGPHRRAVAAAAALRPGRAAAHGHGRGPGGAARGLRTCLVARRGHGVLWWASSSWPRSSAATCCRAAHRVDSDS